MPRVVKEWFGKTDDSKPPQRVRLRRFEHFGGICQLSGRKIRPGDAWELDHITALINGGQNRESNLWPVLKDKHRDKTAADVAEKSMVNRKRSKHLGLKRKSRFLGSRDSGWKMRLTSEGGKPERRDG